VCAPRSGAPGHFSRNVNLNLFTMRAATRSIRGCAWRVTHGEQQRAEVVGLSKFRACRFLVSSAIVDIHREQCALPAKASRHPEAVGPPIAVRKMAR
jgi:hypothetical protein